MKMQLAIICALIGFAVFANGAATYRDAMGRNQGSSSTSGNRTTYRDALGHLQGTAQTNGSGSQTTYRDASGRLQGSSRTDTTGRTTVTQWDAYRELRRPIHPGASPIATHKAVCKGRPQPTPPAASPIEMPKDAYKPRRNKTPAKDCCKNNRGKTAADYTPNRSQIATIAPAMNYIDSAA